MKTTFALSCVCALLISTVTVSPAAAQSSATQQALTLHATGAFQGGGEFTGTVAINRFEERNGQVVAVGFVTGILRRGGRTIGSGVTGEVAWPVSVGSAAVLAAGGRAQASPQFRRVVLSAPALPAARLTPAQASCPVVQIALGPLDVNVLGVQVSLSPIGLSLAGDSSAPLGALVCSVLDLVGNVAGLVDVLNNILGLLIGLLGGLTGGL